jgi:hypothetical protein
MRRQLLKWAKTLGLVLLVAVLVYAGLLVYFSFFAKHTPGQTTVGGALPVKLLCHYEDQLGYASYASIDPMWDKNNKFGLYIYAENAKYFELAQNMVNSSGGSWGYVLIPYNVKDMDYQRWSRVFDQLTAKKLIPIIQLHDVDPDKYKEQTDNAADFLNQFMWPIKYRYISVYNEPNDAAFWYGTVNPKEYAHILDYTIDAFKKESPDFFMLNGALNTSTPTSRTSMDAFEFMKAMNAEVPGIFNKLDGWASHSYPQPNFSGNPHDTGRWSVKAYDVELDFLANVLKVDKDLPVFITETGWAHAEGETYDSSFQSVDKIADNLKVAFRDVWLPDSRVRAVILFTVWYASPYDHFAYVNNDNVPYKHYEVVKSMKKVSGKPPALNQNIFMITVCK